MFTCDKLCYFFSMSSVSHVSMWIWKVLALAILKKGTSVRIMVCMNVSCANFIIIYGIHALNS
jgi:hypothetical protein